MKVLKHLFFLILFFSALTLAAQQTALIWVEQYFEIDLLKQQGFKINAVVNNIISVEWEGDKNKALHNTQGVKYIEQSGRVVAAQKHDSLSIIATKTNELHTNYMQYGFPNAISGKGVIIGVVDIGFQLDHPTFFDRTGTNNRIVRYWNQRETGNAPQGFSYGTLHTDISNTNHVDSFENHGTHVAGIAAGSGYGTPNFNQGGIAYDADIVLVDIRYKNTTVPSGARGDYEVANPAIIDAFDYIFKYADSVGKPAVINLSWGMHTGPHDGTSLFDRALDNLVGNGKIIVGSAGNSRGGNIHFNYKFNNDTVSAWVGEGINRIKTANEENYVDLWGSPNTDFSIQLSLFDTLGNKRVSTPFISSTLNKDTTLNLFIGDTSISCTFFCIEKSPLNNKPNIRCHIFSNYPANNYVVASFASNNTELHGWNSGGVNRWTKGGFGNSFKGISPLPNMKIGDNTSIMGENGGTAKGIVTVGAYTTSYTWRDIDGNNKLTYGAPGYLIGFSSAGPTIDGRIKPDVVAPGVQISSALNKYTYNLSKDAVTHRSIIAGDTNYYMAISGTSMASPQVAGAVALMLQQDATLSNLDVLAILHKTAIADSFTKAVPNNLYGWGKLDVLAAVQAVTGTTAIPVINNTQSSISVYPNPVNSTLNIFTYSVDNKILKCELYDLQGQIVATASNNFNNPNIQLNTSQLKQGLYLLKISTTNGIVSRKISKN